MSETPSFAEYPKTVVLKDGLHLVLRPMTAADAAALRGLRERLPASERPSLSSDGSGGTHRILALDGERVAALLRLDRGVVPAEEHAGTVAVAIDPEYCGRRLGTWMLLDGVHLALGLGMERLIATVAASDVDYLAALRRLDFVDEAVPADRVPPRESPAVIVLAKRLHPAWPDF